MNIALLHSNAPLHNLSEPACKIPDPKTKGSRSNGIQPSLAYYVWFPAMNGKMNNHKNYIIINYM